MANSDFYYIPEDDSAWSRFQDFCDEEGLDATTEDFDAWVEEQEDRGYEARAEREWEAAHDTW